MKLSNIHNKNNITNIINGNIQKELPQIYYQKTINHNFILAGKDEIKLISKIISTPHQTLSKSEWGLGIVTGNNSKHLSLNKDNSERIFTGKDVKPYILEEAKNYIKYKRTSFQQVAPDYIYRATEKLIYKFVSKDLIFAYDNTKSLVLNSANILIPKVKTHSVKTVMAFLNSELFNYLYKTMFNEIKILKGNLITLPFPELDIKTKILIETLVDTYISSIDKKYLDMINETIYGIFGLSNNEVILIKNNMR